jgi:hypothetical protein
MTNNEDNSIPTWHGHCPRVGEQRASTNAAAQGRVPEFQRRNRSGAAKAKPEEFYDNSALQRLEQAGFFKN